MFDIFILIVLLWALFSGWRNGLLCELVSLGGHLAGLLIACLVYSSLGSYLAVEGTKMGILTSVLAFFIIWIIVPIVIGMVATTLTRFLRPLGLGLVNSLGGAAICTMKFVILLSCIFAAMSSVGILSQEKAAESRLYTPLKNVVASAVEWVFDDFSKGAATDDDTATAADTVWIDVPHNTGAAVPTAND